ncbi:MAG TPA: GNAT family N-acetyltransferase [Caulobacteraceae bacterium]|nr:GNAT family N-acetyltransferase [Caulobacteraceae bacterium]
MIVRRAGLYDMAALARLYRHTVRTALPFLPELHTADEDRAYFEGKLFADFDVWTAEEAGAPLGYIAFRGGFIQHLFVDPAHHGRGVGGQLLSLAQDAYAELGLWTFQQNTKARAFYEARGFTARTLTDGQDNEERLPDVFYVWKRNQTPPSDE